MASLRALILHAKGFPRTPMESERSLQLLGTLRERGWQRSIRMRAAVDQQGVALPWFSYPAIDWLAVRIRATDRVFEWGSGSSTLWFSRHAASVVTVEHDPAFADRLHRERPANVTLLQRPAMGEDASEVGSPYASAIVECEPPFDIIVVDGKERNACIEQAIPALAEDGIIVVDNSDRAAYSPGLATLAGAGLWRVDFVGMVPGFGHETTTSMFGRRLDRWLDPRIVLADLGY